MSGSPNVERSRSASPSGTTETSGRARLSRTSEGMMAVASAYALGMPLCGLAPAEIRSVLIYSAEDDRAQYARKAGAQRSR